MNSLYTGWLVLFFPLTFAYLIATKQLYDIHVVLRRILYTVIIAALPSVAIVALSALLFPSDATAVRLSVVFILTLILFSFVLYSLEYLTTKLEAVLFPQKYHLRMTLKKIAKSLGAISSFRELKDIILVDIVNTLQVYGAAIVFKYRESLETIGEGEIDTAEVERLVESGTLEHPSYTCFEINSHEEHTSFLVMTLKKTNTRLGLEEMQWLNLIISYLAVSLENVYLIRKLTLKLEQLAAQMPNEEVAGDFAWFRKLTFELQEKERLRIATDIHDTTMQDLFFLKRRLAAMLEKNTLTEEDRKQVKSLVEYVEIINTNLRQNCFELNPYLLQEIGLVATIRKAVELEASFCPFEIDFRAEGVAIIEGRDLETKRHIFRMFQELLNNAKKHSQASKVRIRLTAANGELSLTYQDNGVGFETKRPGPREIGGSGIGMEQMRSRVLYLDGHFELETGKGRGVRIGITLPIPALPKHA